MRNNCVVAIQSRRSLLTVGSLALAALPLSVKAEAAPAHPGVVILISNNEQSVMGHAISYTANLARHFADSKSGGLVPIEVVANSSGIDLFRSDRSPLQEPLAAIRSTFQNVAFSVCSSSRAIAEQHEGKVIPILDGVVAVPYGIGRVADLQLSGWAYIHG